MSSNGNNNINNAAAAAASSSNNSGRGGPQSATASFGRGVGRGAGRGAGRGRGQPGGGSCHRCGQVGHFARNCPRGNNLQQAPPRGGSTAHRGRGGSVEAGHSTNPPVPTTPVEAGANVMDSPPPAVAMENLSLTVPTSESPPASATSPTATPRVSAPSSPSSRPGPSDSDAAADVAADKDVPPIQWEKVKPEDAQEQERLFVEYYKKKGYVYSEELRRFLPRAHNYWAEYSGETYLCDKRGRSGPLSADNHDDNFVTHTRPASALPELEQDRLQQLAEAKEKLAEAQQASDSPDKTKTVRGLEQEVRLLEKPLEQYVPYRIDEDEEIARRQVAIPNDIAGNNSRRDTMFKFGHIFERMSAVGALGTVEEMGPDLKMVRKNRTWSEGQVWRPISDSKDWADWAGDEPDTPTFHGFIPRHPRPHGIGLGHLGYDLVHQRSRDGVWYTAADVPGETWNQSLDAPIVFVSGDGSKYVVDEPLSDDNPAIDHKEPPKPLSQILAQNRATNAGRAGYQGRGSAPRGGVGRGSGRGASVSTNVGWH